MANLYDWVHINRYGINENGLIVKFLGSCDYALLYFPTYRKWLSSAGHLCPYLKGKHYVALPLSDLSVCVKEMEAY